MAQPSLPPTTTTRRINISPPVLNSSSPWATSLAHLTALYASPYTGAVTTRTSLPGEAGFPHDPAVHRYTFLPPPVSSSPPAQQATPTPADLGTSKNQAHPETAPHPTSLLPPPLASGAINTFGYSPHPLSYYLDAVSKLPPPPPSNTRPSIKPVIISIACSPSTLLPTLNKIITATESLLDHTPLWVELNLSCPNIPGAPPPGYAPEEVGLYVDRIVEFRQNESIGGVKIGLKTPPYTYQAQMESLVSVLGRNPDAVDFLTVSNTLGSALTFLPPAATSSLPSQADFLLGGLSGPSVHYLALGNVYTLRTLLDKHESGKLGDVGIIGVGGVFDHDGYMRMRAAGADVVGLGVGLGVQIEAGLGVEVGVERAFKGLVGEV